MRPIYTAAATLFALFVLVMPASVHASPRARAAATCSDYSNQREAQRRADTRDADGDGIYCESLPCPCLRPGQSGGGGGGGGSEPKPQPKPRKRAQTIRARITAVVDGDTIKVRALERTRRRSYTVRLIGIDTPETKRPGVAVECGGRQAASMMYSLAFTLPEDRNNDGFLDRKGGRGRMVTLITDPSQDKFDRYRRLLAYVTPGGRKMLQIAQLEAGWAKVYVFRRKAFQRMRSFRRASTRARRARRGVFGECGGNFHKRAPARPLTRNEDCGAVVLPATNTTGRLIAIRGVSCAGARAVAIDYDQTGRASNGWSCFLAHGDPARLFSCGKGGLVGDMRNWPAALEVRAVG